LVAGAQAAGKSIGSMDAFIAATVQTAGLVLVTRNVREFAATGVPIHNPWAN
jgi:predicted nucleic acid-binding protein